MTKQTRDMAAAATTAIGQLDQAANEIAGCEGFVRSVAFADESSQRSTPPARSDSAGEAKGFAVVASEVKELQPVKRAHLGQGDRAENRACQTSATP